MVWKRWRRHDGTHDLDMKVCEIDGEVIQDLVDDFLWKFGNNDRLDFRGGGKFCFRGFQIYSRRL